MPESVITFQFTPTMSAAEQFKAVVDPILQRSFPGAVWTVPWGEDKPLPEGLRWAEPSLEVRAESETATARELYEQVREALEAALPAIRQARPELPVGVKLSGSDGSLTLAWRVWDPASAMAASMASQLPADATGGGWGWGWDEGDHVWLKL